MFTINLKKTQTFYTSKALQDIFGTEKIKLGIKSKLTLKGKVTIAENVTFYGSCVLKNNTVIEEGSILTDLVMNQDNHIRAYSILKHTRVNSKNILGPFCFIRDGCIIGNECIIGAHVEATRSIFHSNVKISHNAFIGDASVGEGTIIGAGVIFCNFDGTRKQYSKIGKNVLVGAGSLIISPVKIGKKAIIGAGSIITKDIKPNVKVIQKRNCIE
jgi:bifunctional UDP-N-acetylglucosamine pyrophosphorylase/glucosamine-1-phosphate N-acetyltransferase